MYSVFLENVSEKFVLNGLKQFTIQLDGDFCLGVNFVILCEDRARGRAGSPAPAPAPAGLHQHHSWEHGAAVILLLRRKSFALDTVDTEHKHAL